MSFQLWKLYFVFSTLQIESLTQIGHRVTNVQVPNQGWFIFGGSSNASPYSQRLLSPTSLWTKGPRLYNDQSANGQCAVQVSEVP